MITRENSFYGFLKTLEKYCNHFDVDPQSDDEDERFYFDTVREIGNYFYVHALINVAREYGIEIELPENSSKLH